MPVDTGDRHLQAVVIERTPYTLSKLQELFHMQIVEWDGMYVPLHYILSGV
jgi:hypothetical protein